MADQEATPRQMKDYFIPNQYQPSSCIQVPQNQAIQYEIKSSTIQMLPSFYGNTNEDPYKHIDEFLEICSTVKIQNFSDEALRLTLFPFSLKEKAKYWLSTLEKPIRTWADMQQEFLKKFYPIGRTITMRRAITGFTQHPGEQLHEAWERLKELLRKCPHHGLPKWQIVQAFYEGLSGSNRQMVDASCGGAFMNKSEDEAYLLFETLSENSINHASLSSYEKAVTPQKHTGIYELKQVEECEPNSRVDMNLIAQNLDELKILERKVDQFLALHQDSHTPHSQWDSSPYPHHSPFSQAACSICAGPSHHISECPTASQFPSFIQEQIQAIQGFSEPNDDPFSNSYNSGWRNHPNLSWKNQQATPNFTPQASNLLMQNQFQPYQSQPSFFGNTSAQSFQPAPIYQSSQPIFQQPTQPQANLEEILKQIQQSMQTQQRAISKLEVHIGQLAESNARREIDQLASQPMPNPINYSPRFNPQTCLSPQPSPLPSPNGPQSKNDKDISSLRSCQILPDLHPAPEPKPTPIPSSIPIVESESESESKSESEIELELEPQPKEKAPTPEISSLFQPRVPFPNALEIKLTSKKNPDQDEECDAVDTIDIIKEPIESDSSLTHDEKEVEALFDSSQSFTTWPRDEPLLALQSEPALLFLENSPTPELKPLSDSLKYVFLDPDQTLSMIIAADPTSTQEDQLIDILESHRSTCMHHICIEDNVKPSQEMQRRLNPHTKKVINWLDTG